MPDLIPKEGERGYRKRRTLKLEGFDDEEYYAIQESDRLQWMDNNWKKHIKTSTEPNRSKTQPVPSGNPQSTTSLGSNNAPSAASSSEEVIKSDADILTIGQRIFKTRITCNTMGKSGKFVFNVWINELVKFLLFLGIMTGCTLAYTSNNNYYFIGLMRNKFIDSTGFSDVSSVSQLWDWLDEPFLDAVYDNKIDYNLMIGKPRLRMQRVRPDSCSVHKDFQDEIDICYDSYSRSAESDVPFDQEAGSTVDLDQNQRTPFFYTDLPGSIFGYDYWGQALNYLQMYYAGGYLEFLPEEEGAKEEAKSAIEELKGKEWLSNGARILLIDVQYYNGNINVMIVIRMAFEIPATGGVIPSVQFRTLQHMSNSALDIYTIINEVLFIIIVCYYIGEKIFEFRLVGKSIFKNFENKIFISVILMCIAAIVFKIIKYAMLDIEFLKDCDPLEHQPGDCYMVNFVFWERQFEHVVSIIVFLTWLSLYRFFSDFPSMAVFTKTFSRAGNDLMSFMLVYLVTYLAYAQLGVLIFGNELDGFRNVFHAIYTLFKIILGDFDFSGMQQTNRILGPIYFLTYVFCVFFLLLNMFLAIISDTYSEVKADLSVSDRKYPVAEHIQSIKKDIMKKLNCLDPSDSEAIADAIRNLDLKDDQEINWESFYREMMKCGLAEEEIRNFFQQYDTDGDMVMSKGELDRMRKSLEQLGHRSSETMGQKESSVGGVDVSGLNNEELVKKLQNDFASSNDYELLVQRVAKMENYLGDFTSKVDAIIVNIDQLNQRKKQELKK